MTDTLQALEQVARRIAPEKADVHHLCEGGRGTFSVSTRPSGSSGGEVYALKVVSTLHTGSERTERELAALRDVRHANLVGYRSAGTARHEGVDYRWLAMDHVDGTSLRQLLAEGYEVEPVVAVDLLSAAVSGAAALWDAGTAHGDLSPENLIVTPSGGLVIVDLGFTARQDDARESGEGDWLSDQLALGKIGRRLISGEEALPHAVPTAVSDVIARMLDPDPGKRYSNPAVLKADLMLAATAITAAPE